MQNKEWKLENFKVEFKSGYSFSKDPKEQIDRYEGIITFSNKSFERFSIKLDELKSAKIVELISSQIVDTANELALRINESFKQE
jgi:hypothetical protein